MVGRVGMNGSTRWKCWRQSASQQTSQRVNTFALCFGFIVKLGGAICVVFWKGCAAAPTTCPGEGGRGSGRQGKPGPKAAWKGKGRESWLANLTPNKNATWHSCADGNKESEYGHKPLAHAQAGVNPRLCFVFGAAGVEHWLVLVHWGAIDPQWNREFLRVF